MLGYTEEELKEQKKKDVLEKELKKRCYCKLFLRSVNGTTIKCPLRKYLNIRLENKGQECFLNECPLAVNNSKELEKIFYDTSIISDWKYYIIYYLLDRLSVSFFLDREISQETIRLLGLAEKDKEAFIKESYNFLKEEKFI